MNMYESKRERGTKKGRQIEAWQNRTTANSLSNLCLRLLAVTHISEQTAGPQPPRPPTRRAQAASAGEKNN